MTDKKISQLTNITGSNVDDANDELAIVDASASETKAITREELFSSVSSMSLSGGTIDGTTIGGTTASSGTFTDLTVDEATLSAIAETKADTAVDVFVYDTSKDSDGGAWRHRTQHTSWYNETLDTATRGSRREFPAVAVIVAESNKVTIYDGDDPALPMWMVFNAGSGTFLINPPLFSVAANNGDLIVGGRHVYKVSFVPDKAVRYLNRLDGFFGGVADRNDTSAYTLDNSIGIVANYVNDVAMTVLPDAPIDPATGIQRVTIACATDNGVSVIKDDGTVVDSNITNAMSVVFFNTGGLWFCTGTRLFYAPYEDLTSNGFAPSITGDSDNTSGDFFLPTLGFFGASDGSGFSLGSNTTLPGVDSGAVAGFSTYYPDYTDQSKGMSALLTSTYNTGWMNGDIKGAFLSDTDDTDLVGSGELVTNGDFSTSSDWTIDGGSTGWSITGGVLQGSSATGNVLQDITTVVGKKYVISFEVSGYSGSGDVYVRPSIDAGTGYYVEGDGLYSGGFTATSTTTTLIIRGRPSQPFSGNVDNVSVKLADADRSVNNNGLIVKGTITRTFVDEV